MRIMSSLRDFQRVRVGFRIIPSLRDWELVQKPVFFITLEAKQSGVEKTGFWYVNVDSQNTR